MEYNPEPQKPVVYPVITENIKGIKDVKKLLKAIGLAMTEDYAKETGMEHLIDTTQQPTIGI
jgi:hypothetical protein